MTAPPVGVDVEPAIRPLVAGYTRAGQPLSAAQLATRVRWAAQATTEINRRAGQRRWVEAQRAAR